MTGFLAHHRPDAPAPTPDPTYTDNLGDVGATLEASAAEVVHVLGPLVPDVLPFATAFLLLWWAFDWLIGIVSPAGHYEVDDAVDDVQNRLYRMDVSDAAKRGHYSR